MAEIRAIIFDLDDTLYLERDYTFSGYRSVAAAFADVLSPAVDASASQSEATGDSAAGGAQDASTEARLTSMMRSLFDTPNRPRVFNEMLRRAGRAEDDAVLKEMIRTFREHAPAISLLPDAQRALDRLRGKFKLGLLTDGPAVQQRAKIAALKLDEVFDEIVVTDEIGKSKPDPTGFEMLARALSSPHEACAYVADNPTKDFIAPRALSWRCVRVVRRAGVYAEARTPPRGEPHSTIRSLDDLQAALDGQGSPRAAEGDVDLEPSELEKSWARTTAHLESARRHLPRDANVHAFEAYLAHNELELALDELEASATDVAHVPTEFWEDLLQAATEMELDLHSARYAARLRA